MGSRDGAIAKYGPWALVIGIVLGVAWVLGDLIIRSLENLLTMGALAIAVVALVFLMPVAVRLLRYMAWGADRAVIEANPIAQLEIGLAEHAKMIDAMEGRIAESTTYYNQLAAMLKQNRAILSPDDLSEFEEELGVLKAAGTELVAMRDGEVENHRQFQAAVTAAKAKFAMGRAFSKATATLRFDAKTGQATRDNQAALGAVNRQLAEGLSRMQLALSRPKLALPRVEATLTPLPQPALPAPKRT